MSEESRKHNSHAAESWRELAGDVRQWADGHRLAITATVALVVLNLVVWLVVAMAGFAFPLRLDTSMAEFDFGKLFCTLFLAPGVIQVAEWQGCSLALYQAGSGEAIRVRQWRGEAGFEACPLLWQAPWQLLA